ncbi:MAG: LPS export ABC transporter permease LptG [Thiobacillaceae bacterium]|nr:LPS export ABC transporter permease LptG [Thiobacillaceae bacterium]MDW8322562.1 LPS export ABC transporter permease LptG [Burkholderiales bacterium]
MSILARYLARAILAAVGLALLLLVSLFAVLDFINEVGDIGPRYDVRAALLYVLLLLPSRVHEMLPVATIAGALFALTRLAGHSEFTVMRASGLSGARLVGYLTTLGLALAAASLALGEYVIPHTEASAHQLKARATTGVVAQQFATGLWAKEGMSFINVKEITPDAVLRDVRMYVFDADFRLRTIRRSAEARWGEDGAWRLFDTAETHLSPQGARVAHAAAMSWRSGLSPDLLEVLMVPPERMSLRALTTYIEHLRANRQKTTRYELALWNKLSYTLAAPIMLWLALPFAYAPPRTVHWSGRVLLGLMLGLAFHLANRLAGHVGLLYDWAPLPTAFATLTLFGVGALIALWRVERR